MTQLRSLMSIRKFYLLLGRLQTGIGEKRHCSLGTSAGWVRPRAFAYGH